MLIFGGKILISVPRPEPSPFSVRSDSPDEMFCWWCSCGPLALAEVALFSCLHTQSRLIVTYELYSPWIAVMDPWSICWLVGSSFEGDIGFLQWIWLAVSIRPRWRRLWSLLTSGLFISPQDLSVEPSCVQKSQGTATNIIIIFILMMLVEIRPFTTSRTLHSILGNSLFYQTENRSAGKKLNHMNL